MPQEKTVKIIQDKMSVAPSHSLPGSLSFSFHKVTKGGADERGWNGMNEERGGACSTSG